MKPRLAIKRLLRQVPPFDALLERYVRRRTACFVLSYPKSGRTWLRVLLAKTLALRFHDSRDVVFEPNEVLKRCRQPRPFLSFSHEGATFPSLREEQRLHRRLQPHYRKKRVLFLIRTPQDVMVSYYFHRQHRMGEQYENIGTFLRHPLWGVERLLGFNERWLAYGPMLPEFLLLTYEDMHRDTAGALRRVANFLGIEKVKDEHITQAVAYGHIDHLRELSADADRETFRPTDSQNTDSHKFRQGAVGGYRELLSPVDAAYIAEKTTAAPHTSRLYSQAT